MGRLMLHLFAIRAWSVTAKTLTIAAFVYLFTFDRGVAAVHCIRSGATGLNTGNNWTDAWTSIPPTLIRGDTYYVASGSYGSLNLNTPVSGTNYISLTKAVAADHGTETGWQASYESGQAVFGGSSSVRTGFFEVNGQAEYGFKIDFSQGQNGINVGGATGVTLRFIDFDGITNTGDFNYSAGTKCVTIDSGVTNLLVSHCALHGGESLVQEGDGDVNNGFDSTGTVFEYCHFYNARSVANAFHANIYFCTGSQNGTFRYNRVEDYNAEGFFLTGWEGPPRNWAIYGNVFWSNGGEQNPRGVEIRQDYSYSGIMIYNNTFVNLAVGGFLDRTAETGNSCVNCVATNNLGYNSPNELGNLLAAANTADGVNRFVNLTAKDFHLSVALPGVFLNGTYGRDLTGINRGADGVWDRGAYEYLAGNTNPVIMISPSSLDVGVVLTHTSTNVAVTVQNVGSGTLTGNATVGAPFSVVSGGTYSLTNGQSQAITIRFAPTVAGTNNLTLTFTGGGGETCAVAGVAVDSLPPAILVSPSSQIFGIVPVGTNSGRSFVVQNVGAGTLAGSASVSPPFSVLSGGSYALAGGQTQVVSVRYSPAATGNDAQSIVFSGGGGVNASVSGTGLIYRNPGNLNFQAGDGLISVFFVLTNGYVYQG